MYRTDDVYLILAWREMKSNKQFNLYSDNRIYLTGPTNEETGRHGTFVKMLTKPATAFLDKLRDNQDSIVLFVDATLERPTFKPNSPGRRWPWVRWLSKDDGLTYILKSDWSIRQGDYKIVEHLSQQTNVPEFVEKLKAQGHAVTFVNKKFVDAAKAAREEQ